MSLETTQCSTLYFILSKTYRLALGPTQPPIQCIQGFLSTGVKQLCEFNYSPTSSAQVKNEWTYSSTPSVCLHGIQRHKFTF